MREIELTKGQVAIVDDEDYDKLNALSWHIRYNPHTKSNYAIRDIRVNGKRRIQRMHNCIIPVISGMLIDHINRNTLDNRKANLRLASLSENARNSGIQTNNTSGFKGVTFRNKTWRARIMCDKKAINLGQFNDIEQAARAYDRAALLYHGEFANINFPLERTENIFIHVSQL